MADPGAPAPPPAPTKGSPRLRPDSIAMTLFLTMLVAFGAASNNIYLPSFPAMSRDLGVPLSNILLTLSTFFVGLAIGQLFYGSLSDRFGRRPVLIGGLVAYTLASIICATAPDINVLIIGRALQGLSAASTQVLARAIVRDLYTPQRAARMLSVMSAVFTLVPGLAPVIGGALQTLFGWRSIFFLLTGLGIAVSLVVWWGLEETLNRRTGADGKPLGLRASLRRMAADYAVVVRDPVFLGYTGAFSFAFGGMFSFHASSSFVFIELLHYKPTDFGMFFTLVVVGYFLGSVASARLNQRLGYRRLVGIGGVLTVCGGALMIALVGLGFRTWWAVIGPQFLFMIGCGLVMPNSIAGALAPFAERAGAASALFGFIQQMAGATVIALVGAAANGTEWPMAIGLFSGAVLSLAAYLLVARPTGKRAAEGNPAAR